MLGSWEISRLHLGGNERTDDSRATTPSGPLPASREGTDFWVSAQLTDPPEGSQRAKQEVVKEECPPPRAPGAIKPQ